MIKNIFSLLNNIILILVFLIPAICYPELYEPDKQQFVLRNILESKNPGFENNKAGWTASGGTFAIVTSGSNILTGARSATWDSGSAAQTFTSSAITIPNGLVTRSGVAQCKIMVPSGTATHTLGVYNGTSLIASSTIISSTVPTYTQVPFQFEASASTAAIRITSVASDEPSITVDDCYLGDNLNLSSISQVAFIGSAYIPATASCTGWSRTNTALGAFATDADCPGPTVELNPGPGVIQTTDADLPRFTVSNLPPGNYKVVISGIVTGSTSSSYADVSINDGTTSSGRSSARMSAATVFAPFTVVGNFTYTTAASKTFELYGSANTGSINVENSTGNGQLYFAIYRNPTSSEQAVTPEMASWRIDANIGGADFDLGTSDQASYITPNNATETLTQNTGSAPVGISCSSTNDNTVGATTCPAGSEEPGIIFNLPRAGAIEVCAAFQHIYTTGASGVVNVAFQLINTANGSQTPVLEGGSRVASRLTTASIGAGDSYPSLCGIFNFTSSGKKTIRLMYEQDLTATVSTNQISADQNAAIGQRDVHFTAKYVDQNISNPLLVNSVINTSTGVTRIEAADLNCDAGSAITRQHGSWVSSIGNISGGLCAVTLTGGIFSSTPYCTATDNTNGGGTGFILRIIGGSSTSTNISVDCDDDASTACTAYDFILTCVGAK